MYVGIWVLVTRETGHAQLIINLLFLVVVVGQETDIELFKGDQSLGLTLADSWQVCCYDVTPTF